MLLKGKTFNSLTINLFHVEEHQGYVLCWWGSAWAMSLVLYFLLSHLNQNIPELQDYNNTWPVTKAIKYLVMEKNGTLLAWFLFFANKLSRALNTRADHLLLCLQGFFPIISLSDALDFPVITWKFPATCLQWKALRGIGCRSQVMIKSALIRAITAYPSCLLLPYRCYRIVSLQAPAFYFWYYCIGALFM